MADQITIFHRSHGISFIEVLVACAILALIMAPTVFTFMTGTRGLEITKEELIAQHAGVEIMEQLAAIPFKWLPTGDIPDESIADGCFIGASSPFQFHISASSGICKHIQISEKAFPSGLQAKHIRVSVSVTGDERNNRIQIFETVVAQND